MKKIRHDWLASKRLAAVFIGSRWWQKRFVMAAETAETDGSCPCVA